MVASAPRHTVATIRRLARIPAELRLGKHFTTTRLTMVKSLCRDQQSAERFGFYIAQCARRQIEEARRPDSIAPERWQHHKYAMDHALGEMERELANPNHDYTQSLYQLLGEITAEQNEYTEVYSGPIRLIVNRYLLVTEDALRCFLAEDTAAHWAYQAARNYAERPNSRYGSGLNEESAPFVQDIVNFWVDYYHIKL